MGNWLTGRVTGLLNGFHVCLPFAGQVKLLIPQSKIYENFKI